MTIRTSGEIYSNIQSDLADNNAAAISAADVRNNMADIVQSVSAIVGSGDTDVTYPFYNDLRLKKIGSTGGTLVAESGIQFPNAPTNSGVRQVEPYPGAFGVDHNSLANRNTGEPHHDTYVSLSGIQSGKTMTGNLAVGNNWVNASGTSNMGIRFVPTATGEDVQVSGDLTFADESRVTSGHSVAKAWLYFDASGVGNVPVVHGYHNINSVERLAQGQIKVTFNSGVLADNNYATFALSNARTTASGSTDFDRNTVGVVNREGNDGTALRSVTYLILNEQGNYVDGEQNSLLVFGRDVGAASGNVPTVIGL